MAHPNPAPMPDKTYRALLTDREIEILTGEADVDDTYRYRVITRVRDKIERLGEVDLRVLDEAHDTLGDELRESIYDEDPEAFSNFLVEYRRDLEGGDSDE